MKRDTLHETRAKLEAELAAIIESSGELTQESADTYDRIEDELADLKIQERAADIRERYTARQNEPTTPRVAIGGGRIEHADSTDTE